MAENEHFVSLAHKKMNWKDYEIMLASEKKVSRRLLNMVAENTADEVVE
jgi:Txe/YoeB family toxin of Txe-Axe toxin-antitoxin module